MTPSPIRSLGWVGAPALRVFELLKLLSFCLSSFGNTLTHGTGCCALPAAPLTEWPPGLAWGLFIHWQLVTSWSTRPGTVGLELAAVTAHPAIYYCSGRATASESKSLAIVADFVGEVGLSHSQRDGLSLKSRRSGAPAWVRFSTLVWRVQELLINQSNLLNVLPGCTAHPWSAVVAIDGGRGLFGSNAYGVVLLLSYPETRYSASYQDQCVFFAELVSIGLRFWICTKFCIIFGRNLSITLDVRPVQVVKECLRFRKSTMWWFEMLIFSAPQTILFTASSVYPYWVCLIPKEFCVDSRTDSLMLVLSPSNRDCYLLHTSIFQIWFPGIVCVVVLVLLFL